MDFISDVYGEAQWDNGNQHEVESLGIEHSFFKVLKHEDQVEAGPYGGYIGAEGVFIVVGSSQIDYKQGAARSKHTMDDSCADEDNCGQPVAHRLFGRLYEQVFECSGYNDSAVYRFYALWGHQRIEFDANGHAGQHESHNGEYVFQVKVEAVSPGQNYGNTPAECIDDCNGHVWSKQQHGRWNGQHDTGKSGKGLNNI